MTIKESPIKYDYTHIPSSIWKTIFILYSQHDKKDSQAFLPGQPCTLCSETTCLSQSPYRLKAKAESHLAKKNGTKKFRNLLTMSEDLDEEKLFVLFQVCKKWKTIVYELVSRLFNSKLHGDSSWGLKILGHYTNIIALNLSYNRYFF